MAQRGRLKIFFGYGGGDGTLHETLQGLMRAGTRPALGYIPCGTTNDFASTLKLSRDPL